MYQKRITKMSNHDIQINFTLVFVNMDNTSHVI